MIPEKIGRAELPQETSVSSNEINRTHNLSVFENGKIVGKFIYDRFSSAVSLIHELKVLAELKFTQLEIADEPVSTAIDHSNIHSANVNNLRTGFVQFGQIRKILRQQLDTSRQTQMPCTVILMAASTDERTALHPDTVLFELTSIIGKLKRSHDLLFWYPLDNDMSNLDGSQEQAYRFLESGFCLILPFSGLIKARLLIDKIKKHLDGPGWTSNPITLCSAIGVNTTDNLTDDALLAQVTGYLKKSMHHGGKVFSTTDTSSSSQVTVEEKAQLFMISKRNVC